MHRDLPSALTGGPQTSRRPIFRRARLAGGVLIACVLGVNLLAQTAHADDLTDRRDQVNQQIAQTKRDLSESRGELSSAAAALQRSESELQTAEQALATTEQELATATATDQALQVKLKAAQKKLKVAKIAVADNQKKLDTELALVGEAVRQQYQQRTPLIGVSIALTAESQADVQSRLQWATTIFDTTGAEMTRLRTAQARLETAKNKQAELEKSIAADRAAAAKNLVLKKNLQAAAAQQRNNVAALVNQNADAADAAADQVQHDKTQYSELTSERASVERRIADRIAKARAAAARQEAADRRVREATARAARAKAAAQRPSPAKASTAKARSRAVAKSPKKVRSVQPVRTSSTRAARTSSGGGFSYPVSAPITSKYGMRFHPVLKYWKLHDGTDFGAACSTAIRAPYAGTVSEKYFNAGYGNRLMIDHGNVNGTYLTTGYNHAIRYTVGVGQRVSKGQVIGYVGSTGYSTGCHLHLMLWKNGTMVNPMSFF